MMVSTTDMSTRQKSKQLGGSVKYMRTVSPSILISISMTKMIVNT